MTLRDPQLLGNIVRGKADIDNGNGMLLRHGIFKTLINMLITKIGKFWQIIHSDLVSESVNPLTIIDM